MKTTKLSAELAQYLMMDALTDLEKLNEKQTKNFKAENSNSINIDKISYNNKVCIILAIFLYTAENKLIFNKITFCYKIQVFYQLE